MSEVIIKLVYKLTCGNRSCATRRCVNGYTVSDFIFKCPMVTRTQGRGVKSSGNGTQCRGVGSQKNGLVSRSDITNSKLENSLVSYPPAKIFNFYCNS
jgi:hypothetical protein